MIRAVLSAASLSVAFALGIAAPASAQTLRLMKSIDAPHYDGQRTTWGPTSDIVNMFQDTLVALDWDGRTPIPYLAKSWAMSEDGKIYTFKLRDDVTFCSGKKFTAEDVIYSFKRLKDPAIKAPYAWRAGNIKEFRTHDPDTVLARMRAFVGAHQFERLFRDGAHRVHVVLEPQVEHRTHMQA